MLVKIGNAVVNTDDLVFAWISGDKSIEARFRDPSSSTLRIETKDPDGDLTMLARYSDK